MTVQGSERSARKVHCLYLRSADGELDHASPYCLLTLALDVWYVNAILQVQAGGDGESDTRWSLEVSKNRR